jgi:hypothetical protein
LSSSRDEPGRQNAPDRGTAGQGEAVKPLRTDQRVEPLRARHETKGNPTQSQGYGNRFGKDRTCYEPCTESRATEARQGWTG